MHLKSSLSNRHFRVDQSPEFADNFPIPDFYRADLDNACRSGVAAGGFQVESHIFPKRFLLMCRVQGLQELENRQCRRKRRFDVYCCFIRRLFILRDQDNSIFRQVRILGKKLFCCFLVKTEKKCVFRANFLGRWLPAGGLTRQQGCWRFGQEVLTDIDDIRLLTAHDELLIVGTGLTDSLHGGGHSQNIKRVAQLPDMAVNRTGMS